MAHKLLVHSCIIPNLSAALVEKALFIKMNGLSTDFKVLADWDFWLRSSLVTDFYYIKEPLNNFRQHDTTIRSSIKIEKQLDELYLMMNNLKKQSNKYTDYYINKAIGDIFWGFVVPITNRNILDILMLIVKSMKVSLYEPIYHDGGDAIYVMDQLKDIDDVAYVRYASVHRQFKDINSLYDEVIKILKK